MLTYVDDQMKGTTNHTTIKSTSCLCEKESLQTAFKKVNGDDPKQLFPTLTSDTIETQTEWHTLSTWTWNFSKAINRCSVKRFAITKATKIICSVSSTFLNVFFNQVCKLCVMCACVICVNSKRQHPKIRVHCARIRDADWSAKGMLRY